MSGDETTAAPPAPAPPETPPTRPLFSSRQAAAVVVLWTACVLAVSLFAHPTALYYVETDLVGEFLPAAREMAAGTLDAARYAFKGPGYPLLVAALAVPMGGDVELAARWLSPLAAGLSAWLAFLIARRAAGGTVASWALLALLAAPSQVRYAIEAGTDAPALALLLGSALLVSRPRRLGAHLVAGALAGLAVLTRSNALFLFPCAALLLLVRRERWRHVAAYGLAAALPLAVWAGAAAQAGGLPPDRNYLNLAWELYGRGVPWDRFEATIGARFHSLWDVLAYDPVRVVTHAFGNLVRHRVADAGALVPVWVAWMALPGVVLLAHRRRAWPWLGHGLACAMVLAPVFYNARFALFLLPLYAAAAGAALYWLVRQGAEAAARLGAGPGRLRLAAGLAAAALVVPSGWAAVRETRAHLADAPHETRAAGERLARLGAAGGRVLARKPHVAWYAGMAHHPLPLDLPLRDLPSWARAAGVDYVLYSGIEMVQRLEWGVLADSGVALPGLEQVGWESLPRGKFYALYRVTGAAPDSAAFDTAWRSALARYEARRAHSPEAVLLVAAQYLAAGDPEAARERLERLVHAGAQDAAVERYRVRVALALADLAGAEAACRQAMALEPPAAWHWARLGDVRAGEGRLGEARDYYGRAVEAEPATLAYLELYGHALVRLEDYAGAAAVFERCLRLAPVEAELRRYAMGAWQLAGNASRARELYEEGLRLGIRSGALLEGEPGRLPGEPPRP